jgi:hypothetical protein
MKNGKPVDAREGLKKKVFKCIGKLEYWLIQ